MIRIGLLGAGGHSLACHAPALRHYVGRHPGRAGLAAVCDLDPAKARGAAAAFGFARACASVDELFGAGAPAIDALVAVLPIGATARATPDLLRRGVPLTIEKPLGRDPAEARALVEAVRAAGAAGRVMVSMNRRFDPGLTIARRWLAGQGPPRFVRAAMVRSGRTEPDFVWGTGIHLIDAVNHLVGPLDLREVRRPGGAREGDGWRIATLRGPSGAAVEIEVLPDAGEWEETIRVAGDGYQVDLRSGVLPPWRVRAAKGQRRELDASSPPGEPVFVSNGTYAETCAFLGAVADGSPLPGPSIDDAWASSRLAAAIQAGG